MGDRSKSAAAIAIILAIARPGIALADDASTGLGVDQAAYAVQNICAPYVLDNADPKSHPEWFVSDGSSEPAFERQGLNKVRSGPAGAVYIGIKPVDGRRDCEIMIRHAGPGDGAVSRTEGTSNAYRTLRTHEIALPSGTMGGRGHDVRIIHKRAPGRLRHDLGGSRRGQRPHRGSSEHDRRHPSG